MKLTEDPPSERASLLRPAAIDQPLHQQRQQHQPHQRRSFRPSKLDSGEFGQDAPVDVMEMKKTTHNDPVAQMQDMHQLYGSTRMLYNSVRRQSQGMSSSLRNLVSKIVVDDNGGGLESDSSFSHNDVRGDVKPPSMDRRPSFASVVLTKQKESAVLFLERIKKGFFEDAKSLAAGTIPQSIVLAFVIGTICGIACWLYYAILEFLLELLWKTIPEWLAKSFPNWHDAHHWVWIPIVSFSMTILVGLTVVYMGEPGDLPYTISRVHHFAYIPVEHVLPMVFASMFSILAGGSLGPEAPLVAICGAIGGFVSRQIFRQKYVNVIRKHTLMGMAGALAAFFGAPLGGSIFALEVNSRFGIEYFEHMVESIFCGEICLVVFRRLSGLKIAPIWDLSTSEGNILIDIDPDLVFVGGLIGLIGAFMAYVFATFHWNVMSIFSWLQILDNSLAVYRGLLGVTFVVILGLLVPYTLFWGEMEFETIANMGPAKDLAHVWPTTGYTGFEMDSTFNAFIVGMAKLAAVSFTVAGGLRGGYIFPLLTAGAAFGRVVHAFLPNIPVQICVLCTAAGINVAITRTSVATSLILPFLSGQPGALPPVLMASLCSLFATAYLPFIKTQITRSDIDHSLFHQKHKIGNENDGDDILSDDDESDVL